MAQKFFGELALKMGFVTTENLYQALTVQARAEVEQKPYRSLGQILIDLGYMDEKQVLEVLKVLHPPGSRRVARPRRKGS